MCNIYVLYILSEKRRFGGVRRFLIIWAIQSPIVLYRYSLWCGYGILLVGQVNWVYNFLSGDFAFDVWCIIDAIRGDLGGRGGGSVGSDPLWKIQTQISLNNIRKSPSPFLTNKIILRNPSPHPFHSNRGNFKFWIRGYLHTQLNQKFGLLLKTIFR